MNQHNERILKNLKLNPEDLVWEDVYTSDIFDPNVIRKRRGCFLHGRVLISENGNYSTYPLQSFDPNWKWLYGHFRTEEEARKALVDHFSEKYNKIKALFEQASNAKISEIE